mmetsp:Transcript_51024/g.134443  ORF Transcript_51024/g.134443 Transcript_51024/m.134443 type:complete len:305 (+) Transcript_51024:526-1440(+)
MCSAAAVSCITRCRHMVGHSRSQAARRRTVTSLGTSTSTPSSISHKSRTSPLAAATRITTTCTSSWAVASSLRHASLASCRSLQGAWPFWVGVPGPARGETGGDWATPCAADAPGIRRRSPSWSSWMSVKHRSRNRSMVLANLPAARLNCPVIVSITPLRRSAVEWVQGMPSAASTPVSWSRSPRPCMAGWASVNLPSGTWAGGHRGSNSATVVCTVMCTQQKWGLSKTPVMNSCQPAHTFWRRKACVAAVCPWVKVGGFDPSALSSSKTSPSTSSKHPLGFPSVRGRSALNTMISFKNTSSSS